MGAPDRKLALAHNPLLKEDPMLEIVPDAEASANPLVPRRLVEAFRAEVDERVGDGDFARREEVALALANEVVRVELTAALQDIVASHGTEDVLVGDERYRFHETGSQSYASFVGPLEVERPTFRKVGVRSGPTVVPLDLAAGLVHGTTPALASRFARGKAKDTSRDLFDDLVASHRVPPSRTTLENKGNAIGAALHRRQAVVRAAARRGEALPEGARTLMLGLFRTSSPMEEDLPPETPRRPRKKPRIRKAPPPLAVNYRMAFVGTVAFADADGDLVHTYRYGATAADGPADILRAMMQDVRNALRAMARSASSSCRTREGDVDARRRRARSRALRVGWGGAGRPLPRDGACALATQPPAFWRPPPSGGLAAPCAVVGFSR